MSNPGGTMELVLDAVETGVQTMMTPFGFTPEQSVPAFLGFNGLLYIEYMVRTRSATSVAHHNEV